LLQWLIDDVTKPPITAVAIEATSAGDATPSPVTATS
jgi:hypothetical protein